MAKKITFTKALAIFLSCIFILYAIPASAMELIGDETESEQQQSDVEVPDVNPNAIPNDSSEQPADALGEIISLREANTKHFRMSDGSQIATMYDKVVHFKDDNGKWQDIDNTLTFENEAKENDISGYAASQGKIKIKFANNSNAKNC